VLWFEKELSRLLILQFYWSFLIAKLLMQLMQLFFL